MSDTQRVQTEFINMRDKMTLIHQDTNHDLRKMVYAIHSRNSLEYYNYYNERITNQYRDFLMHSHPDDSEYMMCGIIKTWRSPLPH